MKKLLLMLILFGLLFNSCDAQRNYTAKKLLFSQVQKPYINYGYLYNWWAATDVRGISSTNDWVVPTRANFNTLTSYLGGITIAGGKLKQIGFTYWNTPNIGAINEVGFNARGSGYRTYPNGTFLDIKVTNRIWTTDPSGTSAYFISMFNNATITDITLNNRKEHGESIRLLYVGAGIPTEYVGNDLKIYRVVLIGSQYWLADSLAETKYRNGDWITGFDGGVYTPISNATWAALTTEAMCIYNDNESYR